MYIYLNAHTVLCVKKYYSLIMLKVLLNPTN